MTSAAFLIIVMLWVTLVLVIINLLLVITDLVVPRRNEALHLPEPPSKVVLGVSFSERERLHEEEERKRIKHRVSYLRSVGKQRKGPVGEPASTTIWDWLDYLFGRRR